ncbi:MAG: hypothetical protein AABW65_03125 [Nanoarchaeota archaeon]
MVIKAKKGWLKIVEACVALIIIIGTFFAISEFRDAKKQENSLDIFYSVLDQAAKDKQIREEIFNSPEIAIGKINALMPASTNQYFEKKVKICDINDACILLEGEMPSKETEVYIIERIVSTNLNIKELNPKRIKLYIWKRF